MNKKDLIKFFDENIEKIFANDSNIELTFLSEIITDEKIKHVLTKWPNDIKIVLSKNYLKNKD